MSDTPTGIDETFFTEVLESNKDAVRETVRQALLDGIKRQFEWELPNAVKTAVNEFFVEQVIPEIKAELETNKDEFVDAATLMVRGAPVEIGKAMQEQLAQNLTNSWTLRKVVEACFS